MDAKFKSNTHTNFSKYIFFESFWQRLATKYEKLPIRAKIFTFFLKTSGTGYHKHRFLRCFQNSEKCLSYANYKKVKENFQFFHFYS